MATPGQVESLKAQILALEKIDMEKLIRKDLGIESLAGELERRLERLNRLKALAQEYADRVHDSTVSQVAGLFTQIAAIMTKQAGFSSSEFISNRPSFLANLDGHLEAGRQWEPAFIAAATEARGFLQDEGIRQEYRRTVDDLKNQAQTTITEVKSAADKAINEAKTLAKEIEERARRTAAKVSVEEAQKQFKEAQRDINGSVKLWVWLSVLSILAFFGVLVLFFFVHLPGEKDWHVIYQAVLRLAVLSAVGAIAGFCLKMLRAYMNMRERNLHRQRVANSIEAFVVSAGTPEVRDVILAQLVDAVVTFGASGLLAKDTDSVGSSKIPADAVSRLLTALTKKEG